MRLRPSAVLAATMLCAAPAAAETVTVALNADIRSSSPGVNRDDNTDGVILHVVEGLVAYRENGTVAPLLAEKVDLSADGRTYTFHLRKGVKFHNGAPMTSADVLWSWKHYMDPATTWRCLSEFDGRSGLKVEAVEAPDASTVTMVVNRPSALFLDTLARTDCAAGILHKDSVKADGSWDKPIGTGPFRFGEWRRGQHVTVERFADYVSPPGAKPDGYVGNKTAHVDDVKFVVVPDTATSKTALLSGSLDIVSLLESDVAELQKDSRVVVKTADTAVKHVFLLQTRDRTLSNVKLRQAIAAALDIPQLVANVSEGLSKPNGSAIFQSSAYYSAGQRAGYRFDTAKVASLLAEAGYKGEKIVILANKRSTMPSYPAAVIGQAMLQAAWINAEIEILEWATQLDRYQKGNYQMQSFSYSARFDPALSYEQFSGAKDKQPRKVWDNPEAQALIDRTMAISDVAERQRIFDQLHQAQLADVPLIVLFNGFEATANSRRIEGYTPWVGSKPRLWGVRVVK